MFLRYLLFVFFLLSVISCKKESAQNDSVTGLWYIRIVAEQQVNEKGVLAFKSYQEYRKGNNDSFAKVTFSAGKAYLEKKEKGDPNISKVEYTYRIEDQNLILQSVGTSVNEVYKMSFVGMKKSLVLDKSAVDQNNIPFTIKKVLVRELPTPDKEEEEMGPAPDPGVPTGVN